MEFGYLTWSEFKKKKKKSFVSSEKESLLYFILNDEAKRAFSLWFDF